jgi:flagellar hook-associated protein 2
MTVSSTGTLSSAGLGSGLDVKSIVAQLVAVESQPITDLQTAASGLKSQLSSFGQVQSYMSALRDAAQKLTNASTWSATTATSSDASTISASVSDAGVSGNYSMTVSQLAASESAASNPFGSSAATVGSGSLTITLGKWNADQSGFTAKSGATPVNVTVGASDSLQTIANKINGASAGVTASIVTDSNGSRLSIRSKDSGEENAFRVTAADDDGNNTDATGLSALAYDPAGGATGMARKQIAANALAKINGLDIVSASNTLNNVMDGLSLTLNKTTATPVNVAVASDTASMSTAVNAFATAYNNAMKYMRTQTAYNADNKSAGPLQGDTTAVNIVAQLRTMVAGNSSASSVFGRLTDIGLEPQKDGSLNVNATKLTAALGNLAEVKKFFSATAATGAPNTANGMAQQFNNFTRGMLDSTGAIASRTTSLNSRISDNSKRQSDMQDRVDAYQKRVQAQYSALDTKMASLSGLSTYVTQQITAMNKSNSSS